MSQSPAQGQERLIDVGPAGFLPPSAMQLGVQIPPSGSGLLYGHPAAEDVVIEEAARQLLTPKNPTIFPGPLYYVGLESGVDRDGTGAPQAGC